MQKTPAAGPIATRLVRAIQRIKSARVVDLRAFPKYNAIAAEIPTIERYIMAGDVAGLKTAYAGNAIALEFAAFWVSGTVAFDAPSFQLSVTRYYLSPPTISADYASINRVFFWSDIKTDGKPIPSYVEQPMCIRATGDPFIFSWRLVSVEPVIQRRAENVVSWTFIGREGWAAALYRGGTWYPTPL
jgi:hypothetical protein